MSPLNQQIEALVGPAVEKEGFEIIDLTFQKSHGGWTLSILLDQEKGVTLDDCEYWSRVIGDLVDASGLIDQRYVLEVASPGIDRPISKLKDFMKFMGQEVHVKMFRDLNGQRNFHGTLLGADEVSIKLKLDNKSEVELKRSDIVKCRLKPKIFF